MATVDAEFARLLAAARLPVVRPRELATIRLDLRRRQRAPAESRPDLVTQGKPVERLGRLVTGGVVTHR